MDNPDEIRDDPSVVFETARQLEGDDRRQYLDRVCQGNPDLRANIDSMLNAHANQGEFLADPTVGAEPQSLAHPGSLIGPYKLRERLGEGGMGVVWAAEQKEPLRRRVALKLIKPGMDSSAVIARFEAEREALSLMDHPNVARVLDAGTTEQGHPYFVMELICGVPITEYCDTNKLSVPERLDLFMQVCRAVQHAHQKGIIHRDIKPTNVLVTMHDDEPVPKVIDFGVAKALRQSLTDHSVYTGVFQAIGTLAYMSPEQAQLSGLNVDTRADVYGLGVLLYELLTGTTPFDKETLASAALDEAYRIIREQEPPKPSTKLSTLGERSANVSRDRSSNLPDLGKTIRGDLDWIVMKSLDKNRTRRYETASAFATDIQRFLSNEPIEARPPSLAYRTSKFVRRNRTMVGGVTLLLLALVVGTIGTTSGWIRALETLEKLCDELMQQAHTTAQIGTESELEQAIDRASVAGASEVWANIVRGQFYVNRGDSKKALEYLIPVSKSDPDNVAALALLAEAHVLDGDWEARDKVIERLTPLKPRTAEEVLLKAIAVRYSGNSVPIEVVENLANWRTRPMARVVRSESLRHQANEASDLSLAEKAVTEAIVARELLPNSAISYLTCLNAHRVCYRLASELGNDDVANEHKMAGLKLIEENTNFGVANGGHIHSAQASFYELMGDLTNASKCWHSLVREQSGGYLLFYAANFFQRNHEFDTAADIWVGQTPLFKVGGSHILLEFPDRRAEAIRFLKDTLRKTAAPDPFMNMTAISMMCLFDDTESEREARRLLKSDSTEHRNTLRFFAHEMDSNQYLASAGENKGRKALAHYYIGLRRLGQDDGAGARHHLKNASKVTTGHKDIAKTLLSRLEDDPQWPHRDTAAR